MKLKQITLLLTLFAFLGFGILKTSAAGYPVFDEIANKSLAEISGKLEAANNKLQTTQDKTEEIRAMQERAEDAAKAAGKMRQELAKLSALQKVADAISDPSKVQAAMGGVKIDPRTGKPTGAAYGFIEDSFSPTGQPIGALALAMPPFIAPLTAAEAKELLEYAKERAQLAEGKQNIETTAAAVIGRLRVTSADPKDTDKLAKGIRQILSGQAGGGDYGVLGPNIVIRPYVPEMDDLYYDTMLKKSPSIGRAVFFTEAGKKKYEVYMGDLEKLGGMLGVKTAPSIDMDNALSKGYKQAFDDYMKQYEKQNKGAKNPYKDYAAQIVPGLAVMHANGELAGAAGALTNDQLRRAMELTVKAGALSSKDVPSLFSQAGVTELDKKAAEAQAALEKAGGTAPKEEGFGAQTIDLNQTAAKKYVVVAGLDPVRTEAAARQALTAEIQQQQKLQAEYAITKASAAYNEGVLSAIQDLGTALNQVKVSDEAAAGGAGADLVAIRMNAIGQATKFQKMIDTLQRREKVLDREKTAGLMRLEQRAEKYIREVAQQGPILIQGVKDRAHARDIQKKQIESDKKAAEELQNDPYRLNNQ